MKGRSTAEIRARRRRYRLLAGTGFPAALAWDVAKAEVAARRRAKSFYGADEAAAAKMAMVEQPDGGAKFFLASPAAINEMRGQPLEI